MTREPISVTPETGQVDTAKLVAHYNLLALPVLWTDADTEAGTGGELLLKDETPTDMNRYYRVVEE